MKLTIDVKWPQLDRIETTLERMEQNMSEQETALDTVITTLTTGIASLQTAVAAIVAKLEGVETVDLSDEIADLTSIGDSLAAATDAINDAVTPEPPPAA